MTNLRLALIASMLLTAACAKQRFATQWQLQPTLSVADPNATEFERRERERMEEINVLNAERDDLAELLRTRHRVWVDRDPGLLDAGAQWRDLKANDRNEILIALDRILKISRRVHFLIDRDAAADPVAQRALVMLKSLTKYKPRVEPYYGH